MRKILHLALLLSCLLGLTVAPAAAQTDEDWRLHLSYHNATKAVAVGDVVYLVTNGNLCAYNTTTGNTRHYTRRDGMSGRDIFDIAWSQDQECLVIVYNDFQIDLLVDDGETFYPMPGVVNANDDVGTPTSLSVCERYAAISSTTGFAYLDLKNRTVNGFINVGVRVYGAAAWPGHIMISTSQEIRHISMQDSPYDQNAWTLVRKGRINQFATFAGHTYALVRDQADGTWMGVGLYTIDDTDEVKFNLVRSGAVYQMRTNGDRAVVRGVRRFYEVNADAPTEVALYRDSINTFNDMVPVGNDSAVWVAQGFQGLREHRFTSEAFAPTGRAYEGTGPKRDLCAVLTFDNDRLLVCGGLLFYAGNNNKTGTMMAYENGEWISFQEEGILEAAGIKYYEDITGVAVDPRDAGHCFVTSRTGLYEFQDYQFVNRYTVGNSTLRSPVTSSTFERYVLTSAPAMDEQGNLFLVNDQIDTLIKVRLADGTWDGFYISEVDQAPTCDQILRDQKGRLWMTSRRTVTNHIGGLLYIDYGGTIANKNDDVYRYRNSFTNQDGTTTSLGGVYCVAEAPDGSIWVGTKNGVFQIVNPDEFATNDFRVNQPKVPRNDGTNYADYLLNGTPVTAIAIDGGNRKWLGTESSGLYLASPDGSTILAHYDTDNSILPNNEIQSLAIHPHTGELFIGTPKGLCSLRTSVTEAAPDLAESNVRVYPNPVRPEYYGTIHVDGLTDGADVKVMTAGGQVVAGGTAIGGTFAWNGRGTDGERVAPGVYFFMVATSTGSKAIVAKVVVI